MRSILATVLILFLLPGAVMAQQSEEDEERQQMFGDIPEADINAFIEVYPDVQAAEQAFVEALRNRSEDQDPAAMQERFSQERRAMIEEAGLSMQRYRQILSAMARSDDLREYIEDQTGTGNSDDD